MLAVDEAPSFDMLTFVAAQIGSDPAEFIAYAQRSETRREHLGELQAHLDVRSFRRDDKRAIAQVAIEQANGSDRGDVIVAAMIEYLRETRILLPAAVTLEKVALAARALARKRAYRSLVEGLSPETIAGLEFLVAVADDEDRTPLAWLREWPEAPRQKNLMALIERLQLVRKLGVGPDREKRIHRARYAAIAREMAILVPCDISRFDTPRRLATLVVFAREIEAILTDAALVMFDKMLGGVFRRANRAHQDNVVDRAKTLDASTRALLGMAKAMLAAKAKGEDQVVAVEHALGWERLKTLVFETEAAVANARPDNLAEVVERHASVRRMSPVILGAFTFRSWKDSDPLLAALAIVRELHATGAKKLPPHPPTSFLRPVWRKLVKTDAGTDRRAYEVAIMMALRERLQSGDVWVECSRAFRAFGDFLLPRDLSKIAGRLANWASPSPIASRIGATKTRGVWKPVFARSTLSPPSASCPRPRSPKRACRSAPFASRRTKRPMQSSAGSTPCCRALRVTELFAEVHGWTGFADRFAHLRTGAPPDDARALMTAVLADATNLGLTRMARSSGAFSHSLLLWVAEWHVRDETYQAALACPGRRHSRPAIQPRIWGDGDTSSSDGQFFRAGGHGEARADYNAKYGSEPGVKFYTHVSDRYAPFYSKVIAANASEAAHVLDGLMHHESSIDSREHYTDTAGAIDHVFGLCHLWDSLRAAHSRPGRPEALCHRRARGIQSARPLDWRRARFAGRQATIGMRSCA